MTGQGINGEWTDLSYRRCRRKEVYRTSRAAEKVAREFSEKIGEWLIAYQCPDCNRFHIGHPDRTQQLVYELSLERLCEVCGRRISKQRQADAFQAGVQLRFCSDQCERAAPRVPPEPASPEAKSDSGGGEESD